MATADGTFLCIGTYGSETAARADYAVGKDLHTDGIVGTSDAAVVTKDEMATRHGGWGGAAAGSRHRHPHGTGGGSHGHSRRNVPLHRHVRERNGRPSHYAVGKDLHTDGSTSDAAVVTKDATRHGGSAVIGILFPPAIIGGQGSHLRNQLRFCR
jgi:hypothetical protein